MQILSNLVFLNSPLNFSSPPHFHENMHDFRSPSFFQGRRLRPCFNGVDAPGKGGREEGEKSRPVVISKSRRL